MNRDLRDSAFSKRKKRGYCEGKRLAVEKVILLIFEES